MAAESPCGTALRHGGNRVRPILALLGATLFVAPFAVAQVEVLEPGASGAPRHGAAAQRQVARNQAQPAVSASGELFYQLQLLQDEVMKLRGVVEEQGEQLRQLKQQRLDDYISLDRRISGMGGGSVPLATDAPPSAASGGGIDASKAPAPSVARTVASPGEEQAYRDAYALIQARSFPQARSAFESFVQQYPNGDYAGNAHYWLGELYLLEGDSDTARKHFETLLAQFGDNRRVPDAMFKLGRIYHQSGDKARARDMLDRVVNEYAGSDSTAPQQAREYLQQNF